MAAYFSRIAVGFKPAAAKLVLKHTCIVCNSLNQLKGFLDSKNVKMGLSVGELAVALQPGPPIHRHLFHHL